MLHRIQHDYGQDLVINTPDLDTTTAASVTIRVRKPQGPSVDWVATGGTNKATYTLADGDLDEAGTYTCWVICLYASPAARKQTNSVAFEVRERL